MLELYLPRRKRSPPFRESIHPHKRPRSLDLQDWYTDPGSQPSMKWSSSSSLCSDGGWSESDRRRGWAAYGRDPSPDRRESGTPSGQRHRSPTRGERSSLGHTRRGDDLDTYSTRHERRKEVTGEELQSRAVHCHSLSPHSDSLKRAAPSRLRESHHRSLSPHAEYPGGVAPKDRTQAGDLRHLLLKRGHSRSVDKPPATSRDHRPRSNTSISSEREFTSSCGHLSERSRQSTALSDDVSSLRRDRKEEGSKRQKNEAGRASLSPRSKSRSTDGYGSEGNRTIHHRGEKDEERGSSPRKGGKLGDPTGALDCGDSLTEKKNKGRKRVSEQRDCGRKKNNNPGVRTTGSACKAVNDATAAEESPTHSRQSVIGPSFNSTGESKLFLDGRPERSAVTTPDTCAVSYGYTVTMEKRSTVGKTNSARESVEASRDPRLLSKTEAKPSRGRTDSERARTEASAVVADSLAPEDGGGGTARDGRGDTPCLNALLGISWIIRSPSEECGDHRPAGAVEMSEAVATADPEATPGLPFGYSKKWNADAQKVTSQSKPDDDKMATLEPALDRERLEGQPTERVDSGSGGLQGLPGRGDSCGTADLRGSTPVRRVATSDRSQRYSPSSPTTDCESWEPESEGPTIGCVIPQPTFETAPREAEVNLPGASGGTGESSNQLKEVGGASETHSKHSSRVTHVSGVKGSWTTASSRAHPCGARGGEIQNASHHSVDVKSSDHHKTSDDCATGDSQGHLEPTLDSRSAPCSLASDQSAALVASSADQPRVTADEERCHAANNGEQAEEREERTDGATSCRVVQGTTATKRLRIMNIRRKKDELEEVYRRECLAFVQVAKMMVRHDSTLESHLVQSVRGNLLQMGQRCVQELEKFARLEMSKE